MSSADVAVQVADLRKRYRGGLFRKAVDALRGVSFEVPRGQIFGLLGPNGAGKTTIVKILLGIIRSSKGSAALLGLPAGDRKGRRRVGYLPENMQLPAYQTARTALEYYGALSGMDARAVRKKSGELLERVGLAGRERESVKQFSKGMRQRLGLAQALLHDPELLILDEPTDGLDPVGRSQVRDIMRGLRDEGRTVFVNSHLLQEVELVCTNVAILNHGELRYMGSAEEFSSMAHDSELELEVLTDEPTLRECLVDCDIHSVANGVEGKLDVTLSVSSQSDIDHIIDRLRARRIGIVSLSRRKKTLEDLFLDVVSQRRDSA